MKKNKFEIWERGQLIGMHAHDGMADMIVQWLLDGEDFLADHIGAAALMVPACFSLCCDECLCGEDVQGKFEAEAAGWKHIEFVPERASHNYCGTCPDCIKAPLIPS